MKKSVGDKQTFRGFSVFTAYERNKYILLRYALMFTRLNSRAKRTVEKLPSLILKTLTIDVALIHKNTCIEQNLKTKNLASSLALHLRYFDSQITYRMHRSVFERSLARYRNKPDKSLHQLRTTVYHQPPNREREFNLSFFTASGPDELFPFQPFYPKNRKNFVSGKLLDERTIPHQIGI
ncbi:unnamed protein product [Angiostrongylus costaricensis]|uniref:Uncharacterized protein n=1 Tax=Angiostrongylus costaricensis TaxID=334426 RepID=A0A158PHW3_ANGCS|nr:unnamed protein product [Angiostrongylus costaricensis]